MVKIRKLFIKSFSLVILGSNLINGLFSQNNFSQDSLFISCATLWPASPNFKKLPSAKEWYQSLQSEKAGPSGSLRLLGTKSMVYDDILMTWHDQDSLQNLYDPVSFLLNQENNFIYDFFNNTWLNNNRFLNSYTNGLLSEKVLQLWNGSLWVNDEKKSFTYNSINLCTQEIHYDWNATDWLNTFRYDYSYNNEFLKDTITSYQWSILNNNWFPLNKTIYTYDNNDNLTETLILIWDGSNWINSQKSNQFFNSSNQYISGISYVWNNITNQWVNGAKDTVIYTSPNTSLSIYYTWFPANNTWKYNTKKINVYDVNTMLLEQFIYQVWNDQLSTWINQNKVQYGYDAQQNTVSVITYSWNNLFSQWINLSKEEYSFNSENYKSIEKIFFWDDMMNDWKESFKKFYWYEADPLASIEEISIAEGTIYPNPCSDVLYINTSNLSSEQCHIRLYNLNGQELLNEWKISNNPAVLSIQVSTLPQGVYILQLISDGKYMVKKVIKS